MTTLRGNKQTAQISQDIRLLADLTETSIEEARAMRPNPTVRFILGDGERVEEAEWTRLRMGREIDFDQIVEEQVSAALYSLPRPNPLPPSVPGSGSVAERAAALAQQYQAAMSQFTYGLPSKEDIEKSSRSV